MLPVQNFYFNNLGPLAYHGQTGDYNNNIYVFGGWNMEGDSLDLFKLDTINLIWTKFSYTQIDMLPIGYIQMVADTTGNLYIYGGYSAYNVTTYPDGLWKWDMSTQLWSQLTTISPGREHFMMTIDSISSCIYIAGGYNMEEPNGQLGDMYEYNILTNVKTKLSDLPNPLSDGQMTVDDKRNLYMHGGYDQYIYNELQKYNIDTDTFIDISSLYHTHLNLYGLFGFDGKHRIYLGLGEGYFDYTLYNDLYYMQLDYKCYGISFCDPRVCSGLLLLY